MTHGVQTAFAVIEEQVNRTTTPSVLQAYRQQVTRLTVELDRCAGVTRGRLIEEEDLIEQGRALLLKIEQRIAEETVPGTESPLHPIFRDVLEPFTQPLKQAA